MCLLCATISPHNNSRRGKDVTHRYEQEQKFTEDKYEEKRLASVLDMKTTTTNSEEHEKDVEGRTRQFPHRAGNFATSVRIRCHMTLKEKRALSQIARDVQRHLLLDEKDNNKKDIKVREIMRGEVALHVSLSKVFPVRKEQREPYRSQLKASFNAFRINRGRFDSSSSSSSCNALLELRELRVFVNDERTTTFVAACEKDPGDDATLKDSGSERVREMILAVNEVNERFGFPKYEYEPRVIPHVSFCYADGDWEEEMKRAVEAVVKKRKEEAKEDASVVEITCKTDAVDLCISGWEPMKVFSSESLPPPPI